MVELLILTTHSTVVKMQRPQIHTLLLSFAITVTVGGGAFIFLAARASSSSQEQAAWASAFFVAFQSLIYIGIWQVTRDYAAAAQRLTDITAEQSEQQATLRNLLEQQTTAVQSIIDLSQAQREANASQQDAMVKFVDGEIKLAEATSRLADSNEEIRKLTESTARAFLRVDSQFTTDPDVERTLQVENHGAEAAFSLKIHQVVLDVTRSVDTQVIENAFYGGAIVLQPRSGPQKVTLQKIENEVRPNSFIELWSPSSLGVARDIVTQYGSVEGRSVCVAVRYQIRGGGPIDRFYVVGHHGGTGRPAYTTLPNTEMASRIEKRSG